MSDFLDFMKFAGNPKAQQSLGDSIKEFADDQLSLLREIRDSNNAILRKLDELKLNNL